MDLLDKHPPSRPKDAAEVERRLVDACKETPSDTIRLSLDDLAWLAGDPEKTRAFHPANQGPLASEPDPVVRHAPPVEVREDRPADSPTPRREETTVDPVEDVPAYSPPKRGRRSLAIAGSLVVGLLLIWQGYLFATTTRIRTLKAQCAELAFEDVRVSGTVMNSLDVPLTGISAYKLSDGSGSIWVVSDYGAPLADTSVRVQGLVIEAGALDYVCNQDDAPDECPLLKGALTVLSGDCVLIEQER